jgi:mono/diheme cytochrome c family protein
MWKYAAALVLAVAAAGWVATAPARLDPSELPAHVPDPARGAQIFVIGGCASCHAAPKSEGEARLLLQGGVRLVSPFGTFVAPNISPHPERGIGRWTEAEFVTAMMLGTSPDGRHYYPAFPYASYARMRQEDVRDLFAWLRTLPVSDRANAPHELGFPFTVRRGLGLWKLLNLSPAPVLDLALASEAVKRGQYLVEGPGHCGECHTKRDFTGGLVLSSWLGGAPNPEGKGTIPNLTPGALTWAASDIAYYLESGFTPDFDSAGGAMVEVIRNTSRLPPADRDAIAAYLKAVPAVAKAGP